VSISSIASGSAVAGTRSRRLSFATGRNNVFRRLVSRLHWRCRRDDVICFKQRQHTKSDRPVNRLIHGLFSLVVDGCRHVCRRSAPPNHGTDSTTFRLRFGASSLIMINVSSSLHVYRQNSTAIMFRTMRPRVNIFRTVSVDVKLHGSFYASPAMDFCFRSGLELSRPNSIRPIAYKEVAR